VLGPYVNLAVVVGGACVLGLEILGTRLLGPAFGVGLYLWSALIGVTLAALAVGYALGGRWADRGPRVGRLALLFLVSGLWVALVPWLRPPVLALVDRVDLRAAVLVSGTVLFFPPLVLLGMVSPYAIRLKAGSLQEVGRTAGNLYALSTCASVVAALGTGFWLIPALGVGRLTFLIGVLLMLTGGLGLLLGRRPGALPAAVMVAVAVLVAAGAAAPREHADPARGLVAIAQSAYGELRVVDLHGQRAMLIDGAPHSLIDQQTGEPAFPYVDVLGLTKRFFAQPGRLLLVGLGAGTVAKVFARDGWQVQSVEIDPEVTRLARAHFAFGPADGPVDHADGRRWLVDHPGLHDLIILDAFGSSAIPFHLVTSEAFALCKSRLRPGGVLAMNVESVGWDDILVRSLAVTVGRHFAHVKVLPTAEPPNQLGNVIIVASDRALELPEDLPTPPDRWSGAYNQVHAWDNAFTVASERGVVLTDEHNPVAVWSDRVNVVARAKVREWFGPSGVAR
jgi:predicted membrane-bound spermidine synthase